MLMLVKEGGTSNSPVQEYYADTLSDINNLPEDAIPGSSCLCLEDSSVRIKNTSGQWVLI